MVRMSAFLLALQKICLENTVDLAPVQGALRFKEQDAQAMEWRLWLQVKNGSTCVSFSALRCCLWSEAILKTLIPSVFASWPPFVLPVTLWLSSLHVCHLTWTMSADQALYFLQQQQKNTPKKKRQQQQKTQPYSWKQVIFQAVRNYCCFFVCVCMCVCS